VWFAAFAVSTELEPLALTRVAVRLAVQGSLASAGEQSQTAPDASAPAAAAWPARIAAIRAAPSDHLQLGEARRMTEIMLIRGHSERRSRSGGD
jgi:hypothetical protein